MNVTGDWQGARVLVTGAGGFVGRHLVERLSREGARVLPLTRARCDLTDRRAVDRFVRAADPDAVLHLAAARQADDAQQRLSTAAVNTLSGLWIVEALGARCRTVVRLGSSTEYAESPRPMDESTPLCPRGWFGATKAAGSLLLEAAARERGLPVSVLRAFQVYGPGDKPQRFVPVVLDAARRGSTLPLTQPGRRRDWVWVGDVVEACLRAAVQADRGEAPHARTFNIGTGVQTANEELVRLAERTSGRRIATQVGAHPGRHWDTADWVCDTSKARRELGWEPTVELADGLARCWAAA
jgi:nucleoside-diphosphate-sugar epimerase